MDAPWLLYLEPALALVASLSLVAWARGAIHSRRRIEALEAALADREADPGEHVRALTAASERAAAAERAVEQLAETIREFPEIARRLTATHELRDIPQLTLELIDELFHPRYSVFFRIARGDLVAAAVRGETSYQAGDRVRYGEGVVGWAAIKQMALTPEDIRLETRITWAEHLGKGPSEDFQLCLPIVQGERTIGVILIGPSRWELPHGREIGTTIALLTSAVITTARYLRDQKILARRDGLTGLLNKTNIREQLEYHLGENARIASPLSVFLFDLDHFKHYNDANGHLAGDQLLKELGGLLMEATREGEFVGRYGGEEFLVVLPGVDKGEALQAADRIRSCIISNDFAFAQGQPLGRVTISGGISGFPVDGTEAETLLKRADEALYQAKRAGRDRILAFAGPELTSEDLELTAAPPLELLGEEPDAD